MKLLPKYFEDEVIYLHQLTPNAIHGDEDLESRGKGLSVMTEVLAFQSLRKTSAAIDGSTSYATCFTRTSNLLLIKALKMQQDDKDTKNEIVVKGFKDKIKKLDDSLKEKDDLLQSAEGSLVEEQAQNKKLSKELKE
ncbi:hypothetical protein ACJX0J_007586, partial [Zea mays]